MQFRIVQFVGVALVALVCLGCGGGSDSEIAAADQVSPFGPTGIPPSLRAGSSGATRISPGSGIPENLKDNAGVVLDPEDIVFTDPDAENPDAIVSELKELLSDVPDEGPWKRSLTNTLKEARRNEKPVLIWFHDSINSPNSKALAEELFNRQEFEDWAGKTFVRLQVDRRVEGSRTDNETARKTEYVENLKVRYKVRGQPTLVVLSPDGTVIHRYSGYKRGQAEYKWGQLRQGASVAMDNYENWKQKQEKKGYRMWSDPRGRRIFAKLVAYREGELTLVEPDGSRAKTKEGNLSPADQDWISAQKRARGLE